MINIYYQSSFRENVKKLVFNMIFPLMVVTILDFLLTNKLNLQLGFEFLNKKFACQIIINIYQSI